MIPVVFINGSKTPYVDMIIRGEKIYETRTRNTLGALIGRRVLIAETGKGIPRIRCSAILDNPIPVDNKESWDFNKKWTCVPDGSEHDWNENTKRKWLYHLIDVREVFGLEWIEGKRHGITWMEYEPLPYDTIWDGDSFIDGQKHESLESAICDAEDTLCQWMADEMWGWEFDEKTGFPKPTQEQIENWDYMIYNCGSYVVPFDYEIGEYAEIDDAVWPRTDEDTDKLGWMLWEDYVKKFGPKEDE